MRIMTNVCNSLRLGYFMRNLRMWPFYMALVSFYFKENITETKTNFKYIYVCILFIYITKIH